MSRINVANFRHPDGTSDNISLDDSGRVLVGPSSWTGTHKLSVQANATNSTGSGNVALIRGESAADMSAGDVLGRIEFLDQDGGRYAFIDGRTDAASGASDNPGRLTFQTTADGNSAPTEAMRIDSSQNLRFNSGYGSVATAYGVRAWVNFQGTGTVAIRDDGNVSSVTDNGTGDYTVNFSTAMPDVNYSVGFTGDGTILNGHNGFSNDFTTTSHRFTCMGRSDSYTQSDPGVTTLIYVR